MLKLLDRRFPPAIAACVLSIASAAYGAQAAQGRVILGDEALQPQRDFLTAGKSEAFRLRAHASGLAADARIYIDRKSTARTVVVGVYDNADDRPGSLLSTGSISSPLGGSWTTVPLAPTRLVSTRTYWLTILGEDGTLRFRDRRHGQCRSDESAEASLNGLPASWHAGRTHAHTHCSVSAYILEAAGAASSPIKLVTLPSPTSPPGLPSPTVPTHPVEAPSPPAPTNTALPVLSGTYTQGQVLSSTKGEWSGSPTSYTYQWQDCNTSGGACSNVSGATTSSHMLGSSDIGHTMRVIVTATNVGGSTPATSGQTADVSASVEGTGTSYPACTQTLSEGANISSAVSGAAGGSVICLNSGSYGHLTLSSTSSSDVTLQAAPAAHVTTGEVEISGSHLVVRGLWVDGEVVLEAGASHITIDHNDITGGGEGIYFNTSDCTAPNAPTWAGCEPDPPITNVIISGNHIHNIGQPGTEDALHLDNWRSVTVSDNEFDHIIESGNHTDCLQSVFGGSTLNFTHNYEHDNDCQGIFIKDGDATGVSFTDNLFLRDDEPDGGGERFGNLAQIWNTQGVTIERNTIWDGKGMVLVAEDAQNSPSATVDHNLFSHFSISKAVGTPYTLTESYNIFDEAPLGLSTSSTDSVSSKPQFDNTATDDYRLASNPNGIGIDWSPAVQQYGPIS